MTHRAARFTTDDRSAQELAKAFLEHEYTPAITIDGELISPSTCAREGIRDDLSLDTRHQSLLVERLKAEGMLLDKIAEEHRIGGTYPIDSHIKTYQIANKTFPFLNRISSLAQGGIFEPLFSTQDIENGLLVLEHCRERQLALRSLNGPIKRALGRDEQDSDHEDQKAAQLFSEVDKLPSFTLANIDKMENLLRNIAYKLNVRLIEPAHHKGTGRG